ncbi:hypothetical protein VCRA2119O147_760024 [Vibrio crassostreae]|nr:hypothetical protein VCRA2112O187_210029 [Vibrio crassostreae]CAK1935208.1 hypothetical protein VCRA2113O322_210031 [Vibrio crassostreae]CAK1967658.1 hypothetical protein VCRA2118O41_290031 [Vibrio crassostreae]CAK1968100.1 hypothetical protein VCRA2113O324_290032 [Vibrio crassostreae]CAK1977806.1 hypothetical protein VCRA2113O326_250032 [Vibrio crassostreae]
MLSHRLNLSEVGIILKLDPKGSSFLVVLKTLNIYRIYINIYRTNINIYRFFIDIKRS